MKADTILAEEYYKSFLGGEKLYEKLKDKLDVSKQYVLDWVKKQAVAQQMAPSKRRETNHYKITSDASGWQCDIMFFAGLERENAGYFGVVLFEQIASRFAVVYKIKNKDARTVGPIFAAFIDKYNPGSISSDNGTEFKNASVGKICKDAGVEQHFYEKGSHTSLGTIDSLTRTLRDRVRKWMLTEVSLKWTAIIETIVDAYNTSVHSTLGRTPAEAAADGSFMEARHREAIEHNGEVQARMDIAPGDKVRHELVRGVLEKSGTKWSARVYTVERADGLSYVLKGLEARRFRPWQLLRIEHEEGPAIDLTTEEALAKSDKAGATLDDLVRVEKGTAKTVREIGDNPILGKRAWKPKRQALELYQ